jgi:exosortase/archaeosortase family protein
MIARVLKSPWVTVAAATLACWPVWTWYAVRLAHLPGQLTVLVPLALALVLTLMRRAPAGAVTPGTGFATAAMCAYAAVFHFVPPLVRALFAVVVLGAAVSAAAGRRGIRPGILLLLGLALPVVPTAQFYLGYPLRVVTGEASSWMLALAGYDVARAGAILDWGGRLVAVDAACSGVRMLWTGLFVAAAIAAARDFGWRQTIALAGVAVAAVLAGNVIRTVALFFPESRLVELPSWAHDGIGLVCFGLMVAAIILLSRARFIARTPCSAA